MAEDRNYLTVAALVVVGLVVLIAVAGAAYLLFTSLVGVPTPTPTPTPEPVMTPTPYAIIPSGPVTVTATPSGATPLPTAVQPVVKSSSLVGYGTDKDVYKRGDTAIAYMVIKNTGTVPIDEATLNIKVERYVSIVGYVNVQSPTTTLTGLNIKPGETKRAEYLITIPGDYEGVSTAGKYRFTIEVIVWGNNIGSFQKEVTVQ
ncbi:hypothetical protein MCP_2450 [Methanocella paludicola SANAE]|uniref:Uncharacterized protein n=1 Tax=Methanocella paludicola (strain DSM 17711 / JCM 13418 / NBRC 101707 / SANAE) TaxID=304371 RepID=D1Z1F0_METPS|nr:hypothetical protein [Methanocella paludicola]BAI62522.1 hypothetical protein MCP_2450 [Methanocella paludicola SANAE]